MTFSVLTRLDDIGLISLASPSSNYVKSELPQHIDISYYGTALRVEFKNPENNELGTGKVIFTNVGEELARICSSNQIDGFYDYVTERWTKQGLVITSP